MYARYSHCSWRLCSCALAAPRHKKQYLIGTFSYDGSRGTGLRQHTHIALGNYALHTRSFPSHAAGSNRYALVRWLSRDWTEAAYPCTFDAHALCYSCSTSQETGSRRYD